VKFHQASRMLNLTEDDVKRLAPVESVIDALAAAFSRDFSQTLRMPVRSSLALPSGGVLLVMSAYDSVLRVAGVKTITVTKARGVDARYDLLDGENGAVLARMEANWLTDLRTAATSALATKILARPDACTLGIFGTGRQAEAHIAILPQVKKFTRILVCGTDAKKARQFCYAMTERFTIEAVPADPETCIRDSDVVCTCTTSRIPVFDGRWLGPGTHLNLIGAFQPDSREVDDETILRSRVIVDTYAGALAEAGDLLIPLRKRAIPRDHILADLHEVASGQKRVRRGQNDITLFKSVGCALEDLVTAKLICERARA
jgi:ornithine cyclodeaminase/alanine dehydrogenase-like protein (mu-crystallin family)